MPTIEEIRARADAAKVGDRISYANLMLYAISDELFLLSEIDRLTEQNEMASVMMSQIEALETENERLTAENSNLRNGLCLQCGKYHEAHKGACDGCRWKRS